MSKKKYVVENVTQVKHSRQKWADYHRLRARPKKVCTRCLIEKPNNKEHFHLGVRGRITGTCLMCLPLARRNEPSIRAKCPICDEVDTLVRDLRCPPTTHTIRMCRSCLVCVHALTRDAQRHKNLLAYAKWCMDYRGRVGSQPLLVARPEVQMPVEVPPDDDEAVTGPVGEPDTYPPQGEVEALPRSQATDTYEPDYLGE